MMHAFPGDWFPVPGRPLALAIVYEDSDTHQHATHLYEFLLRHLDEEAAVTATWWRTSLVPDPKLSKAAARAIAAADLIIVSVHVELEPSSLIRSWMQSWPIEPDHSPKLVSVLLGADGSVESSDWDACLRELAESKGLCYLAGSPEELTPGDEPEASENRPVEPYAHWGLNE